MSKPTAAIIRENELLRDVASKAIRLRHVGRLCEDIEAAYDELRSNSDGHLGRSATMQLMREQAFATARDDFDQAVLRAAEAGMNWADEWKRPLAAIENDHGAQSEYPEGKQ